MKLKTEVLELIKEPRIRVLLQLALDVTEQTIIRYIKVNSDDLTKAAALRVIKEETGLPEDEILEMENATA